MSILQNYRRPSDDRRQADVQAQVLSDFATLRNSSGPAGITDGDIVTFKDDDFTGEGRSLC
ncbi:uncharacterized protein B0H18DRAFT_1016249 [Fomitopsis serialis]|uniref:uncharacterized protein n=1 Tax=Fomitopsis serialis TaxID=139415 RepID=UPI002007A910|nr:uncharacterized protein B0H18DRAFT_1016249 [Neoantrodia serialis]KAH9922939.1 hypothetical protein B0H18DRAFT_1016249 [Neoantrodia serialis]